MGGGWDDSAPVTSLAIMAASNFIAGSRFCLYGEPYTTSEDMED
jgi:hypothetical protein